MKIKNGDTVKVISGKDKGKTGKVLRVIPKYNKVVVENINVVKKHQRPNQQMREGGIIEQPSPIYSSKVMVVCSSCGNATRVGYKKLEDGKKVRYCKKCGEIIDKA
ncbi:50S ribosomal protein L24 [Tepiditoga spiralis]|uniref:Large ribosomal subunit protein uL24 n=1 Tax=Tepiditoga spiralis TaxID=2108365 RepID=A0A7G1G7J6_9BACT|nr:50S ribosomal protein L24 [Tepiditoga spiralis]BBE30907.1 50S ribosomal protein L24 [Tepiditoga spiralis]